MHPIIGDHQKPQLSKTEKAVSMLQLELDMVKNWNQGLQRQIAGICLYFKITPKQFSKNTRQQEAINAFLLEAQEVEKETMEAEEKEKNKALEALEALRPKEDGI